MSIIKAVFGWLFRQGVVFVLIVAALAFYYFAWPKLTSEVSDHGFQTEWMSPEEIGNEISLLRARATGDLEALRSDLSEMTDTGLAEALVTKSAQLAQAETAIANRPGLLARIRPSAILERKALELDVVRLNAEIALLESASGQRKIRSDSQDIRFPSEVAVDNAVTQCQNANAAARQFNSRNIVEKASRNVLTDEAEKLSQAARTKCEAARRTQSLREQGLQAREGANQAYRDASAQLAKVANDGNQALRSVSSDVTERTLRDLLLMALAILAGIIAMPFVIRIIFYHILAPLAERRSSIRIEVPGGSTLPVTSAQPSRVSIPVTLGRGEELLVRQDYLQSTSLTGTKATRWLLDYRHILSSIASGLSFLTRVRGEGETTTVSASRDPFAELAEISLPEGAACVLHPRALVAVVQPEGQTMRVTSHWRIFSLNAWLTLQLRYMAFHGPGRLIVMGGRGVRVEVAQEGRIFGQDQLLGFSADLAYSVTRNETFWPYFFGRDQLFRDRVEEGSGILIIEESPNSGRNGASSKRGLEGVFDAGLKAFGL